MFMHTLHIFGFQASVNITANDKTILYYFKHFFYTLGLVQLAFHMYLMNRGFKAGFLQNPYEPLLGYPQIDGAARYICIQRGIRPGQQRFEELRGSLSRIFYGPALVQNRRLMFSARVHRFSKQRITRKFPICVRCDDRFTMRRCFPNGFATAGLRPEA